MKRTNAQSSLGRICAFLGAISLPAWFALLPGCAGKVDDRFSAETYDEYQQPLTKAIIGTPAGVITVGSPSIALPPPPVASDGGPTSSGGGGSSSGGPVRDAGFCGDGGGCFGDGGPGGAGGGFGSWHFDDCSATSNFLIDSSGEGANAQHALGGSCVPGVSGLGVQFRTSKDIVQVPDEPQFTVSSRIGVAAWVHPTTVTGNQPIVIKRLNNQTSFSLGIHNGNIEMAVVLTDATTVISRAPIAADVWTHVAGMYDGTFVFLFINGQQFGQVFAGGALRNEFAPIRIGATTQSQHFSGIIDEVFVSTEAISSTTLTDLACIRHPSTLAVTPPTSGPVPFDTTVNYDIAVSDNDFGFCRSKFYDVSVNGSDTGINVVPGFGSQPATPGTTVHFSEAVTGSDTADPGVHVIPFSVFSFEGNVEFLQGSLTYELAAPTGCFVFTRRELMITDLSVVDDPVRTAGVFQPGFVGGDGGGGSRPPPGIDAGTAVSDGGTVVVDATPAPSTPDGGPTSTAAGVWTFGQLARNFAPTPDQAPAMVEKLLDTWLTDQTVNGFTVAARPAMQQDLLGVWPRTASGALDLDRPPLTLQAIVARVDLRDLSVGSAGEGRFVFGVNGPGGFPLQFTVILEYNLPATTQQEVVDWANRWHALSSHPFPSEEYNVALEAVTQRFTGRGASPGSVNGSALVSLRTNEIALSGIRWELRQFELAPDTTLLREIPVVETPDISFNGTSRFADFVNQNEKAILALLPGATGNTAPLQFEGNHFQGGSALNGTDPFSPVVWSAPGIINPEARFHASINTCNGCHGPDTNTFFLQISPRFPGSQAVLSPFLTGTTAFDGMTGQPRTLNDLARRRADLTSLVCGGDAGPPPPPVEGGGPPPPSMDAGTSD